MGVNLGRLSVGLCKGLCWCPGVSRIIVRRSFPLGYYEGFGFIVCRVGQHNVSGSFQGIRRLKHVGRTPQIVLVHLSNVLPFAASRATACSVHRVSRRVDD